MSVKAEKREVTGIRLTPSLYKKVQIMAIEEGCFTNEIVERALRRELAEREISRLTERQAS